jgi:hypothetical protein
MPCIPGILHPIFLALDRFADHTDFEKCDSFDFLKLFYFIFLNFFITKKFSNFSIQKNKMGEQKNEFRKFYGIMQIFRGCQEILELQLRQLRETKCYEFPHQRTLPLLFK